MPELEEPSEEARPEVALPSGRSVVAFWAVGMLLVGIVTWQIPGPTELQDPDLAHQQGGWKANPGTWLSGASNPDTLAPDGVPEGLIGKERFVLTFSREAPSLEEIQAYRDGLGGDIPVVAVVNGDVTDTSATDGISIVSDPDAAIVDGFGMRRPVDGGYPIGIAVINSAGLPEYVTLDPGWTTNSFECRLVLTDVN